MEAKTTMEFAVSIWRHFCFTTTSQRRHIRRGSCLGNGSNERVTTGIIARIGANLKKILIEAILNGIIAFGASLGAPAGPDLPL